jgi:hypothetical protein
MTNGGVDRAVECTGNINAMIQALESVHDVQLHIINNTSILPIIIFVFFFFNIHLTQCRDGVWRCLSVCRTKTLFSRLTQYNSSLRKHSREPSTATTSPGPTSLLLLSNTLKGYMIYYFSFLNQELLVLLSSCLSS